MPFIDQEVTRLIRRLYHASKDTTDGFEPLECVRNFSLRVSMNLSYGVNLDNLEPTLVAEIFEVESGFGKYVHHLLSIDC
jgi:hypothetical protein